MKIPKTLGFWELFKFRKPIIFYGGRLHYVERNSAQENNEARSYALFRIYHLTVSCWIIQPRNSFYLLFLNVTIHFSSLQEPLTKLRQAIISVLGPTAKVSFKSSPSYSV